MKYVITEAAVKRYHTLRVKHSTGSERRSVWQSFDDWIKQENISQAAYHDGLFECAKEDECLLRAITLKLKETQSDLQKTSEVFRILQKY